MAFPDEGRVQIHTVLFLDLTNFAAFLPLDILQMAPYLSSLGGSSGVVTGLLVEGSRFLKWLRLIEASDRRLV